MKSRDRASLGQDESLGIGQGGFVSGDSAFENLAWNGFLGVPNIFWLMGGGLLMIVLLIRRNR